ncbi:MAG: 4a-hydroxytetrahydrobiopterin dehydratase [Patescibacteria group bacterium]
MEELRHKKCVPCEKGGKALEPDAIHELHHRVKGWDVVDHKEIKKTLSFIDFKHAISFVQEVADLAEYEGHHPDLNIFGWNKLTITLSTHSVKGLTENDFIMAAKIDQLLAESEEIEQ